MKLFKFDYSPYARKVEVVLDLAGLPYTTVEVPYGDRKELVAVTGGYLQVPVLVDDNEQVWTESRRICEQLLVGDAATKIVPSPFEGPIWAYADFCDGPLEDVLFRVATPSLVAKKPTAEERALFVYIKERKFGTGCVDHWLRERDELLARGHTLLRPTLQTLRQTPFLFGAQPSLADAALYGNLAMLEAADPALPDQLGSELTLFMRRLEAHCATTSRRS